MEESRRLDKHTNYFSRVIDGIRIASPIRPTITPDMLSSIFIEHAKQPQDHDKKYRLGDIETKDMNINANYNEIDKTIESRSKDALISSNELDGLESNIGSHAPEKDNGNSRNGFIF